MECTDDWGFGQDENLTCTLACGTCEDTLPSDGGYACFSCGRTHCPTCQEKGVRKGAEFHCNREDCRDLPRVQQLLQKIGQ